MPERATVAGGSATAGGINFQAAVTGIVEVHAAVGASLDWLNGLIADVPEVVSAETGGAGDDIGIRFVEGAYAEVQVKRGLRVGPTMWDTLLRLAKAIDAGSTDYGVVVVCPNSSKALKYDLARDLQRLSGGRSDGLKPITQQLVAKLESAGISVNRVARCLRIVTLNCLASDSGSIGMAKALLVGICTSAAEADRAWNALYVDAGRLMEFRGARAADSVVQLLRSEGVLLKNSTQAPSAVLDSFCAWTSRTNDSFAIPGISQPLSIDAAWIELDAIVLTDRKEEITLLAEALERYHAFSERDSRRTEDVIGAATLARFVRRVVLIGGPGMGKSTLLRKLARDYSLEGLPVFRFAANRLASRMKSLGCSFEEGVIAIAAEGSGLQVRSEMIRSISQGVLLCDGLDEAGYEQEILCEGLAKFAEGHPDWRIVVTTRPIGYTSNLLRVWRHCELQPLTSTALSAHVERIIEAATADAESRRRALEFARAQMREKEHVRIAARSPLILGLISSLLVHGMSMGETKNQLYERLFASLEGARGAPTSEDLSSGVLAKFLSVLAWEMLHDRSLQVSDALARCGEHLGKALGEPALKAGLVAAKCLAHWERVGMVEKVHHAGLEAVTFIHKTFGEYAAARHLIGLPRAEARRALDEIIGNKAWSEVLIFAASLGLIDLILAAHLQHHEDPSLKVVAGALSLLRDAEALAHAELRAKVFDAAIQHLRSPIPREAIPTGNLLLELSDKYPQDVVQASVGLLEHKQPWTRLAAQALATIARPSIETPVLKLWARELPALIAEVNGRDTRRYLFEFSTSVTSQVDALCTYAVRELLERVPADEADELVRALILPHYYGTSTGQTKLIRTLREHGRSEMANELEQPQTDHWEKLRAWLSLPSTEIDTLVEALYLELPPPDAITAMPKNRPLWQLSGFLCATDFMSQPASDILSHKIVAEEPAVRGTLRATLLASGVDRVELGREIAWVMTQRDDSDAASLSRLVYDRTEHVDIEMQWERAQSADLHMLSAALHSKSTWIAICAANLIASNATQEQLHAIVQDAFATGNGDALWAASHLCNLVAQPGRSQLLMDRLEHDLTTGCQHLYTALAAQSLECDEKLQRILRRGLLTSGPLTATATAEIADKFVLDDGVMRLLEAAFEHWQANEAPYPKGGGSIPKSPRERILKALLKRADFDNHRLVHLSTDVRSDVAKVASDALLAALKTGDLTNEFLAAIAGGELPPRFLAQALEQNVPLLAPQAELIATLLDSASLKVRQAALQVLREPYLPAETIRTRARKSLHDSDPEIRDRARRLLGTEAGSTS